MGNTEYKIAEDVAIEEVKKFVEEFTCDDIESGDVKVKYPQVVKAVMFGLLVFDGDGVPTLTLKEPIKNTDGAVSVSTIDFLTRLKVEDQKRLAKGLDMKKDGVEYSFKAHAFFIKQPLNMIDKFGRFDWKVIEQVVSVFF